MHSHSYKHSDGSQVACDATLCDTCGAFSVDQQRAMVREAIVTGGAIVVKAGTWASNPDAIKARSVNYV